MKFPTTNFASFRESVKERMYESPLDRLEGPPTYTNVERLVEQLAISSASVRLETGDPGIWAGGAFGCLVLALGNSEIDSATGGEDEAPENAPGPYRRIAGFNPDARAGDRELLH